MVQCTKSRQELLGIVTVVHVSQIMRYMFFIYIFIYLFIYHHYLEEFDEVYNIRVKLKKSHKVDDNE